MDRLIWCRGRGGEEAFCSEAPLLDMLGNGVTWCIIAICHVNPVAQSLWCAVQHKLHVRFKELGLDLELSTRRPH
jgi:hypothetical protein